MGPTFFKCFLFKNTANYSGAKTKVKLQLQIGHFLENIVSHDVWQIVTTRSDFVTYYA